jgi:hypothetical protein
MRNTLLYLLCFVHLYRYHDQDNLDMKTIIIRIVALIPAKNPIEFDLDELGLLMIPELMYHSCKLLVSCDTLLMVVNGPLCKCKSQYRSNERKQFSSMVQTSLNKLINHGVIKMFHTFLSKTR